MFDRMSSVRTHGDGRTKTSSTVALPAVAPRAIEPRRAIRHAAGIAHRRVNRTANAEESPTIADDRRAAGIVARRTATGAARNDTIAARSDDGFRSGSDDRGVLGRSDIDHRKDEQRNEQHAQNFFGHDLLLHVKPKMLNDPLEKPLFSRTTRPFPFLSPTGNRSDKLLNEKRLGFVRKNDFGTHKITLFEQLTQFILSIQAAKSTEAAKILEKFKRVSKFEPRA